MHEILRETDTSLQFDKKNDMILNAIKWKKSKNKKSVPLIFGGQYDSI